MFSNQGVIDTETRAVCSGEYSDISPLSGGNVAFGTLEKRFNAYEFTRNKALQVRWIYCQFWERYLYDPR